MPGVRAKGRKTMKKLLSVILALCVCLMPVLGAGAESAGAAEVTAAEDELLAKLEGTYIELFPEFAKEEYKDYWMEVIKAWGLDDDKASYYYTYLTATFMGRLKGQEAVDAYSADPASMLFDCYFENGVAKFRFSGNVFSGYDADGNEIFSHTYTKLADMSVTYFGTEMDAYLHVYSTEDDAGMFKYFAFSDDNPADTQHIEFRYGESLDDMGNYSEGAYAYWLPSGILDGYEDSVIKDCIKLFVDENVGEAVSGAQETTETVEIATADDLAKVRDNLSGNYVLTADIDLNGYEWDPIGVFVPGVDENGQPTEYPDMTAAFTGSFDGNGHTISNFTIGEDNAYTAGLFGCMAGASLSNLTVSDVYAEGYLMVSDVVGYAFMSSVSGVKLVNGTIHVIPNEMSEEGMFGGIVAAGMGSRINGCEAQTTITVEDGATANLGIVGGGLQATSVSDSIGRGSITLGSGCYGIGGVSGCGFGSEYFTNCAAEDVTITVGDNCSFIGGITGYCGGYEAEEAGVPVTQLTGCRTKNVTIVTGENADNVGDFVGGGFISDEMIAYGSPFDQPTEFVLTDCVKE